MSKDLVPFNNEKSLTPGKGGGLKFWRLQREKQALRDEITDMAAVMRRLSQELIEQLLFLKAPDRAVPEVLQRRMSQIVGALKRESKVLTSLFAIGDLHPALQRIFLEKRTPEDAELPAIDLELLEAPAALMPPVKPTLLHTLSNREIEILTYSLAGYKPSEIAPELGVTEATVSQALYEVRKRARELVGKPAATPQDKPTMLHSLTGREIETLTYVLADRKPRDIAKRLGVKRDWVYNVLYIIRKKASDFVAMKENADDGKTTIPMD